MFVSCSTLSCITLYIRDDSPQWSRPVLVDKYMLSVEPYRLHHLFSTNKARPAEYPLPATSPPSSVNLCSLFRKSTT